MPPPEGLDLRSLDDAALCNVVDVTGCVAPLRGEPPQPALVFRFTHVDGTELPPAVLVLTDSHMREFADAVHLEVLRARSVAAMGVR